MSDEQPLLAADGLGKHYGERIGCRDVSFALWPGEVLAVVGEFGLGQVDPAEMPVDAAFAVERQGSLPAARRADGGAR